MLLKRLICIISIAFCSSLRAGDGHASPVANFLVNNLCYKSITSFSNTSTGLENPVFQWTIYKQGNAVPIYTSSAVNINFQFPAKTTYTVKLELTNYVTPTHTHLDQIEKVIFIDSIPIANFDLEPCQSQFTNLSCCATSFTWDFGDGTPTSTVVSPAHSYTAFATFTVTLTASNGTQTAILTNTVDAYVNTMSGDFTVTHDADTIRFKSLDDSLKGSFCDWEWDFGDGSALDVYGSDGWKVKHYYQPQERDSIYTVTLVVNDGCFGSEEEKTVLIKGIGKNVTSTTVFPSPVVYGYLNVESNELDKLQEIKIIDCLGKRLDNLVPSQKAYGYYFYINEIPNGVYIVQLVFSDRVQNHKIIKE